MSQKDISSLIIKNKRKGRKKLSFVLSEFIHPVPCSEPSSCTLLNTLSGLCAPPDSPLTL